MGRRITVRTRPTLDPGWSAAARQQLLTEIASLDSTEEATSWARKSLEAKNSLTSEDAKLVEEAFALRMTGIGESEEAKEDSPSSAPEDIDRSQASRRITPTTIDKGALTLNEPRRYRNKEHRKFISLQPCLVSGRRPSDSHHVRFAQPRAFGRKVSDEFSVPVLPWPSSGAQPVRRRGRMVGECRHRSDQGGAQSLE